MPRPRRNRAGEAGGDQQHGRPGTALGHGGGAPYSGCQL